MGSLVIKVGILGFNEGNGHPFSYSAIINGFDSGKFAECGWPVIHDYLRRRDPADFGIDDLRVAHVWMPSREMARKLAVACDIPVVADTAADIVANVDAAIIARDDPESHWELAAPFLARGVPVFVDKPLAAESDQVRSFLPYIEAGKLMSCSGMRYATELDEPRANISSYGQLKLARAALVLDWTRYGIHAIDAILSVTGLRATAVVPHAGAHESVAIETTAGTVITIDSLGAVPKLFNFDFIGTERISHHHVSDNFSMFRRTLWHFATMLKSGVPPIAPQDALESWRILIAGRQALKTHTRVELPNSGLP